jgi:hypothetical protein
MDFVKPDCEFALQRKTRIKPPWPSNSSFSPVHVAKDKSRKMGIFRVFRGKSRRDFSAVKTCWRSECESNSHYRFESRNPRRLRNLQAVRHLTGESTSSDWPLGRLRTVHLFVRSLRRTAYDSVAESGHPLRPGRGGGNWRAMTTRMGAQSRLRSLSAQRAAKRQVNRDSQRFLPVLFRRTSGILAGEDEIPFVRSFPRCPPRARTITS